MFQVSTYFFSLPLQISWRLTSYMTKTKKVVLFSEIGQVKVFLSTTRPHKSNVHENIYSSF